ncbi:MAG TPA: tetratricopeptide repeat protein [Sphingorhabdus lacus]|nr:tetratricopeptide repeat protein [Sphingorhabdus lacus]
MSRRLIFSLLAAAALAAVGGLLWMQASGPQSGAGYRAEAKAYMQQGDLRSARVALMNAAKADPRNVDIFLTQAKVSLDLFDSAAALVALNRAQALGAPKAATAHLWGHAYWLDGDLDSAQAALQRNDIPDRYKAYALRIAARVAMDKGDLAQAQSYFDAALQMAPRDSQLWTDLARLRFVQADQKGAIDAVDYAFKLDPQNVRALEFRGRLMRSQFGVVASLPWFERGLQLNPVDIPLLEEYGLSLGDAGRYRDMLAVARKIISLDRTNAKAYYMQAVLAARAGEYELASRILPKAGSNFEQVPAAMLLNAICAYELGNYNKAVDHLQELLGMQPRNRRVRILLAQALYRAGDPLGALDTIKEIASRPDADSYSLMLTARAFEASDQPLRASAPLDDGALATFRPALPLPEPISLEAAAFEAQREPNNARIVLPYIRLLAAQGNNDAAWTEAVRLQNANPGVADAHVIVGDIEMARGNTQSAVNAYQQARQITFTEPVMLRLVDALGKLDRQKEASETLSAYLQYNPTNLTALRLAGYRHLDVGNWNGAILMLERVRKRLGNNDAILLANLARAYAGANQMGKALGYARTAYDLAPANVMVTQIYGQLELKSGKRPKAAMELLQKAQAMMPENQEVAAQLSRAIAAYRKSAKRQ